MSFSRLRIDYGLAVAETLGPRAPSVDALSALRPRLASATTTIEARAAAGTLGFWNIEADETSLADILAFAASVPTTTTDVLVLGIGGSSLGARAIQHALVGPPELASGRRLHIPDNSDPWLLSRLLDTLVAERTLVLVVSKSGATVETAAQLLVVDAWLEQALGAEAARAHLVAITDPSDGILRTDANARGLRTFSIPKDVGGRFSVLTPVGLVPAAVLGVDIRALVEGARAMRERCRATNLEQSPAALIAGLAYLHTLAGHDIHVFMPYAEALRPFAAWFVQLWAESLGKRFDRSGNVVERGPTPLAAIGATDQHAQVQLFIEGPRDKLVLFVTIDQHDRDITLPMTTGPLAYLGGKTMTELLAAEHRGTALALASDGRPSLTIALPRLDAHTLGGLFFLFEAATALAGELFDVDAFDQPGVELGKRLAFCQLGRIGFEDEIEKLGLVPGFERFSLD